MTPRHILLHLRLPFSVFLMPIFWLAVSQQAAPSWKRNTLIFVILHLLVYPASNAFNSYFDKDEGSIGGLKKPPAVDKHLYWVATVLDMVAIVLAFFISVSFSGLVMAYILVSRLYSHPLTRFKKRPVFSWLLVGLFQGVLVYAMTVTFGQKGEVPFLLINWWAAGMAAFILWAIYPITQVYQHDEDSRRGDLTISRLVGIRGTFILTVMCFSVAVFLAFFGLSKIHFIRFLAFSLPVSVFVFWWMRLVWQDPAQANFKYTMRLNLMASVLLNLCFLVNSFA